MEDSIDNLPWLSGFDCFMNASRNIAGILTMDDAFIGPNSIVDKIAGRISGHLFRILVHNNHSPVLIRRAPVGNAGNVLHDGTVIPFALPKRFQCQFTLDV